MTVLLALERAEITQLSNILNGAMKIESALERAEITQLSNQISSRKLQAHCFRTSRNYTALKHLFDCLDGSIALERAEITQLSNTYKC